VRLTFRSIAVLLAAPALASAATYLVNPDGSGDFPTIQAAIHATVDGDVVELGDGVFTGDGNRDLDYVGRAITIRSRSGDPGACVLDCQGAVHHDHQGVRFRSAEGPASVFEGVTITRAYRNHPTEGAGIDCAGASPTIRNCVFRGNAAEYDGAGFYCRDGGSPTLSLCVFAENESDAGAAALYAEEASPRLEDCRFTSNVGEEGAAILFVRCDPAPALLRCEFQQNTALWGGAIACRRSSPSLMDCSFSLNAATLGGAVDVQDSAPQLEGCRFEGNSASMGGAVRCCRPSAPFLRACTFADNVATSCGGAAFLFDCSALVVGCTFHRNSAPSGGGLYVQDMRLAMENTIVAFGEAGEALRLAAGAEAELRCCDLYGNDGGDWVGGIEDQLGMNGNLADDPLFCGPGSGDLALDCLSPCAAENNPECGQIGAWPVGCGPTPVTETTWGVIKSLFGR